jgi:hypothetical protein
LHLFPGLAKILQDDRNVHVDNNKKAYYQIADKIRTGHGAVAAVASRNLRLSRLVGITVRRVIVGERFQHATPASRGAQRKQSDYTPVDGLEIEKLVYACVVFYIHEEVHAENGVDEYD